MKLLLTKIRYEMNIAVTVYMTRRAFLGMVFLLEP